MSLRARSRLASAALAGACLAAVVLGGCGEDRAEPATVASAGFPALEQAARGQTVRWWTYGGDDRVNSYIDDVVAPAAAKLGIDVKRVPVADTADAIGRVVAQRRAGKIDGGAVDLIWINGENFAAGKKENLWLKDWATELPNAKLVDFSDPGISRDLRVPIDGQESPWSGAAFVFAHDAERTPDPPATFDELLAYAKAHSGRVTYPAPPDFTGTSFVKQVVIAKGEDEAFRYLAELKPLMWRGGEAFPQSEGELNRLFADGQVDFAMSFDPSFIANEVGKGDFGRSTRPFLLEGGALVNTSYVTIPADAAHPEGAQVLANLLLDPRLQALKADPESIGVPSVLDPGRLDPQQRQTLVATTSSPYLLQDFGDEKEDLAADAVAPLEARWMREILP